MQDFQGAVSGKLRGASAPHLNWRVVRNPLQSPHLTRKFFPALQRGVEVTSQSVHLTYLYMGNSKEKVKGHQLLTLTPRGPTITLTAFVRARLSASAVPDAV